MTNITKLLKTTMLLAGMLLVSVTYAQQGIGTNNPNPNAALDIATTNKGLLIPRVALTSTADSTPLSAHVAGMTVYNTATSATAVNGVTPGYYVNDGTKWVKAADAAELVSVEKRLTTTETGLSDAVIVSAGIRTDLTSTQSDLTGGFGTLKEAIQGAVTTFREENLWQAKDGSVGVVELSKAGDKHIEIAGSATMASANITTGGADIKGGVTADTATITGATTIGGNTTISGTTTITGLATMRSATMDDVTIGNGAVISGGAKVDAVTVQRTAVIGGNTTIGTNLNKADLVVNGTLTTINGETKINGATTIGTALDNANLEVNGTLTVINLKGSTADDAIVMASPNGVLKKASIASISTTTAIIKVTGNYDALASDGTILVDASAGNVQVTLPKADTNKGKKLIIKKIDNGSLEGENNVTISTTQENGVLDGTLLERTTTIPHQTFVIQSDGAAWWIIN